MPFLRYFLVFSGASLNEKQPLCRRGLNVARDRPRVSRTQHETMFLPKSHPSWITKSKSEVKLGYIIVRSKA